MERVLPFARMLEKLISGGQTGVDRAALDVALSVGLPCGGWCPRGRRAEDGVIPARYPLRETLDEDPACRTEWNVWEADGTLILGRGPWQGGTALTVQRARQQGKPLHWIDLEIPSGVEETARWLEQHQIRVLNVAGPRESEQPGIYAQAFTYLQRLFHLLENLKSCHLVREKRISQTILAVTGLSNGLTQALTCHPDAPVPFPQQVEVSVQALTVETWCLRYVLSGDITALRIPTPSPPGWAEGLWRQTCCELFLGDAQGRYLEGNFSPSGAWAVYRFSGYRAGMTPLKEINPTVTLSRQEARRLELQIILPLASLRCWLEGSPWRLGLSVVAEDTAGRLYYWALYHPEGRPDFHHSQAFALSLGYEETA
ncbi:MAG TPA: putative molybdenum carrier protein [Candidatus Competibacteraceae bacterium]|nr:putative molybdenum carrier protein [Candidatus Competibacteraceae bacterium]